VKKAVKYKLPLLMTE